MCKESLDIFVWLCVGYCVIIYIFGVGDCYFDNLLLVLDGYFFYVDFGYIFGCDLKFFVFVMKFFKEMVDCMGGFNLEYYW